MKQTEEAQKPYDIVLAYPQGNMATDGGSESHKSRGFFRPSPILLVACHLGNVRHTYIYTMIYVAYVELWGF